MKAPGLRRTRVAKAVLALKAESTKPADLKELPTSPNTRTLQGLKVDPSTALNPAMNRNMIRLVNWTV